MAKKFCHNKSSQVAISSARRKQGSKGHVQLGVKEVRVLRAKSGRGETALDVIDPEEVAIANF
jgi:hypothetical protein